MIIVITSTVKSLQLSINSSEFFLTNTVDSFRPFADFCSLFNSEKLRPRLKVTTYGYGVSMTTVTSIRRRSKFGPIAVNQARPGCFQVVGLLRAACKLVYSYMRNCAGSAGGYLLCIERERLTVQHNGTIVKHVERS